MIMQSLLVGTDTSNRDDFLTDVEGVWYYFVALC